MSGALSLEQVLARSLRAPKRRPGGFPAPIRFDSGRTLPLRVEEGKEAETTATIMSPISKSDGTAHMVSSGITHSTFTPLQGTKLVRGFSKQEFAKKPVLGLFKSRDRRHAAMAAAMSNDTTTTATAQDHLSSGSSIFFNHSHGVPMREGSGGIINNSEAHHHHHHHPSWMSAHVNSNLQDRTAVLFSAKGLGDWQTALAVFDSLPLPLRSHSNSSSVGNGESQHQQQLLSDTQLGIITDTCLQCGQSAALTQSLLSRLNAEAKSSGVVAHTDASTSDDAPPVSEKVGGHLGRKGSRSLRSVGDRLLDQMLDHFGKAGESEAVVDLIKQISPERRRSVTLLNSAMGSFESGGQWHKALDWFHENYNAVPLGEKRSQGGGGGEAELSLTPSRSETAIASRTPSTPSTRPNPNVVTFATLMAILETAGRVKESQELLHYYVPVADHSAIMSSYAALIVVWSQRHGTRGIKKF